MLQVFMEATWNAEAKLSSNVSCIVGDRSTEVAKGIIDQFLVILGRDFNNRQRMQPTFKVILEPGVPSCMSKGTKQVVK